jgi:hypothetical protein
MVNLPSRYRRRLLVTGFAVCAAAAAGAVARAQPQGSDDGAGGAVVGGGMKAAMPADPVPHSFSMDPGLPDSGRFNPGGEPPNPLSDPIALQRLAQSCGKPTRQLCPGISASTMPDDAVQCLKVYRTTLPAACRSAVNAMLR